MSNAIEELKLKRGSLLLQIADAELKVHALMLDLSHVEATLRLLKPGIALNAPVKPPQKRAARGEVSRPILSALRVAQGPVTTRELARAILQAKGQPAVRISTRAYDQARYALKELRSRGVVVSVGKEGQLQTWALVPDQT
ncbi:MAG: hypothetical protein SGJ23_02420 [Alphaproteobacteria bacterium]|nr:hypothetical protein [Alphaproteobacteria bacterium]